MKSLKLVLNMILLTNSKITNKFKNLLRQLQQPLIKNQTTHTHKHLIFYLKKEILQYFLL